MAGSADRLLVRLHEPSALAAALGGPAAQREVRLRRLVDDVYRSEGVELDTLTAVRVTAVQVMRPLAGTDRVALTWAQQQPSYVGADLRGTVERSGAEVWADLHAHVEVDVVAAVDPGGVESAVTHAIEDVTSLDDFASRFRYLDLEAFLARRRISTVEELRRSAEYVLAEVRLRPPPPFDPTDPAHAYTVGLDVAVAVREDRDLVAALRAAQRMRAAAAVAAPGPADPLLGRPERPFAVAVALPAATADAPSDAEVDAVCARAGVLPLLGGGP